MQALMWDASFLVRIMATRCCTGLDSYLTILEGGNCLQSFKFLCRIKSTE